MSEKLINYSLLYWQRTHGRFQLSTTFLYATAIRYTRPTKYISPLLPYGSFVMELCSFDVGELFLVTDIRLSSLKRFHKISSSLSMSKTQNKIQPQKAGSPGQKKTPIPRPKI